MATFIEVTPDAFNETFRDSAEGMGFDRANRHVEGTAQSHVRRPVRGIQIKDDTYATIQVRTADGRFLPMFDAAGQASIDGQVQAGRSLSNSNFLIQQVQEQRAEKQQIVLTFGAPYIFFFGEQPRILQVQGVLLNTEDFNWRAEWWENYDLYLRGTKCVENRARVYLSWDDIIVEGYIMSSSASEAAMQPNMVMFQFQMFLTHYHNVSSIGDPEGHLTGKTINLNPSQAKLLNQIGSGTSNTLAVRLANEALEAGRGKGSLLEAIRNRETRLALQHGTDRLVEIQGQIVDILDAAGQFVSGRNIRVPRGFEGSAVFGEAEVALASVRESSTVRNIFSTTNPATYGPLYLNKDEFIARHPLRASQPVLVSELFQTQQAAADQAYVKVREAFERYGIDVEPTDELTLWFRKAMFGIASVAVGAGINTSSDLRQGINLVGSGI